MSDESAVEKTKQTYLLIIYSFSNSGQIHEQRVKTIPKWGKPMTNFNFGFLERGTFKSQKAFMKADGTTKIDTFRFETGTKPENVAISTGGSSTSPFGLSLFQDMNANNILDNGDAARGTIRATDDTSDVNDAAFESLNVILKQGVYFAQTKSFATRDISYTLFAERAKTGEANPLTSPEIPLGQISQDLQKTNRVNNSDTADNFAFTLDSSSSLDIDVRELGSKKGDVNIRVVQDLNGNGAVDKNEIVVKGTSTLNGSLDTIAGFKGAGDYILQVCQSSGNTRFGVNFNHSAV
ncbi:hypothetical protein [Leptolyngbya ohadii]|uniref:hypothetical protein n=1 Tax=Leptolyngbya ohadii TaxID=1962290 RepID=UPI000B5A19A9|nr:hypothetical protein [Leptolyngbya ohadii]